MGVLVSLATVSAAGATVVTAVLDFRGASELSLVIERAPIPLRRPPARQRRAGADFVRKRSPEQLAESFRHYFKPSSKIDDPSEQDFVFD